MEGKNKELTQYVTNDFVFDELGRIIITETEIMSKVTGAIDFRNELLGFDLWCDSMCCNTLCACNTVCVCNVSCNPCPHSNPQCHNGMC
jgi:hypothetical protein